MIDETFGLQLRSVRQERGLSRQELADRLGISSPNHIWEYESGKRDIRIATVRRIAVALNVSAAELLEEDKR